MEKEYTYGKRDNLVGITRTSTEYKPLVFSRPKTTELNQLTAVLKPSTTTTLSKPVDGNTALILQPNVEGGLKTLTPSPVNVMTAEKSGVFTSPITPIPTPKILIKPVDLKTFPRKTLDTMVKEAEEKKLGNAQASLKLPSMYMILGLIAAVVVFYFIKKKA